MKQKLKCRTAVFGMILCLLLFSGCQLGNGTLVAPGLDDPAAGEETTAWQTLLLNEMKAYRTGYSAFSRDDDAMAEKALQCVKARSGDDAAQAEAMLKEYTGDTEGYATGYIDIASGLGIGTKEKTYLIGYAIVPPEDVGREAMWESSGTAKQLAGRIMQDRCFVALNEEQSASPDHVGFAAGDIGGRRFIIALFR